MELINVSSTKRVQCIDITDKVSRLVNDMGWEEGALVLFVPHTTAGITINEGADPAVHRDVEESLTKLIPYRAAYHHLEGNSDAHIKTTLTGNSALVILENGRLRLGTWQAIFFCEYDGPRSRKVWVQYLISR